MSKMPEGATSCQRQRRSSDIHGPYILGGGVSHSDVSTLESEGRMPEREQPAVQLLRAGVRLS
jgi:hypothetical protein